MLARIFINVVFGVHKLRIIFCDKNLYNFLMDGSDIYLHDKR